MRAQDIVETVPTVAADEPVADAIRLMARNRLPGLIVVDASRVPRTVLPGTQVLRLTVPHAHQEDPALVRTIDEAHSDLFWSELGDRTIGECLPRRPDPPAVVPLDATLMEAAVLMARVRSPMLAVVDAGGRLVGAITLERLLDVLAGTDPAGG
ncbi:MAG: CBS domain-containing protein [Pseudonocardia sp.]|nr:CBS domain-containing protein [Pseudonocardia sp.]